MRKALITGPLVGLLSVPFHVAPPALALDLGGAVGSATGSVSGGVKSSTGGNGGGRVSAGVSVGVGSSRVSGVVNTGTGGVSGGVSVGTGGGRVSGGVSAATGGGAVSGGVSAGTSGGGVSAGVSASTSGSRVSAGTDSGGASTSVGSGGTAGSPSRTVSRGPSRTATTTSPRGKTATGAPEAAAAAASAANIASRASAGVVALPAKLRPKRRAFPCSASKTDCLLALWRESGSRGVAVTAAPDQIILACRDTIVAGAMPYDPVRVEAVPAGNLGEHRDGGMVAPLVVRITYARQGGYEVRKARVKCTLDASGQVASLA